MIRASRDIDLGYFTSRPHGPISLQAETVTYLCAVNNHLDWPEPYVIAGYHSPPTDSDGPEGKVHPHDNWKTDEGATRHCSSSFTCFRVFALHNRSETAGSRQSDTLFLNINLHLFRCLDEPTACISLRRLRLLSRRRFSFTASCSIDFRVGGFSMSCYLLAHVVVI